MLINIDDDQFHQAVIEAVTESVDFDRHVNELVDSLLNDQIEEHLGRLDIDEIEGFESRAEEIARDVASEVLDDEIAPRVRDAVQEAMADVADPQNSDDRIADLEQKVSELEHGLASVTAALESAASLLALAAKVVSN